MRSGSDRKLLEIARRFVLRTKNWPGLKNIYQGGYDLGLSLATSGLKSHRDVLAVLLRRGREGRNWVPGLSDYDLTILTDPIEPSQMMRFLEETWAKYKRMKRVLPQLGETEIMNTDEFADFLTFGPMPSGALKYREPLFVRPGATQVDNLQQTFRHSGEREVILDALSRYVWFFFPAWLHHASDTSHLTRRRAEHLLGSIVKRLQHLGVSSEMQDHEHFDSDILKAFDDLSRVCTRITASTEEVEAAFDPGIWKNVEDALPSVKEFASAAVREAKVEQCSVILWISYMSTDKMNLAFVIPDETPRNRLWKLVTTLGALHRKTNGLWKTFFTNGNLQPYFPSIPWPVVVSRSMWKCWRELAPFVGAAVGANGRTLMGPDDASHGMPSMAALRRGTEIQYAAILPLKNNWRPLPGPATPQLYEAMINQLEGYASVASGAILMSPTPHRFESTLAGYRAVCQQLEVVRKTLTTYSVVP